MWSDSDNEDSDFSGVDDDDIDEEIMDVCASSNALAKVKHQNCEWKSLAGRELRSLNRCSNGETDDIDDSKAYSMVPNKRTPLPLPFVLFQLFSPPPPLRFVKVPLPPVY